jgi:hypothetical protein
MAFDVLAVDAIDMRGCPWAKWRRTLEELHGQMADDIWRVNTAFADGPGLLAATAGMGLEGVVAKRVTSRYWPGRRTPDWRKVKHRTFKWFELLGRRAPAGPHPRAAGWAGRPGRRLRLPGASLSGTGPLRRPGRRARRRGPGRGPPAGGLGRGRGRLPGAFTGWSAARTCSPRCPGRRLKLKTRQSGWVHGQGFTMAT